MEFNSGFKGLSCSVSDAAGERSQLPNNLQFRIRLRKGNFDIKRICIMFHGPLSYAIRHIRETFIKCSKRKKVQMLIPYKGKVHPCTGTEALYWPYGP